MSLIRKTYTVQSLVWHQSHVPWIDDKQPLIEYCTYDAPLVALCLRITCRSLLVSTTIMRFGGRKSRT
jgi:hypothetical protein